MDDALVQVANKFKSRWGHVLILVVMDDALVLIIKFSNQGGYWRS